MANGRKFYCSHCYLLIAHGEPKEVNFVSNGNGGTETFRRGDKRIQCLPGTARGSMHIHVDKVDMTDSVESVVHARCAEDAMKQRGRRRAIA